MSDIGKLLKVAGAIIVVIGLGALAGWMGTRGARTAASAGLPADSSTQLEARPLPARAYASVSPARSPGPSADSLTVTNAPPPDLITNWEDRLDEILTSDKEDADKAQEMAAIFPKLPEEGQVEAAQHLSNLIPDEQYASIQQYLTNSSMPEDVLDVLLSDVLNRPNSLKLPALLAVARDEQNPKSGEARDLLQLFLDEDYGTDWNTWQTKMEQWLQDNPD